MANVIIDYSRLHGLLRPHSDLCNLYWNLRYCREWDKPGRRRWYRRIKKEKELLVSSGGHPEFIRLLCRHLANPSDLYALARLMRCRHGFAS